MFTSTLGGRPRQAVERAGKGFPVILDAFWERQTTAVSSATLLLCFLILPRPPLVWYGMVEVCEGAPVAVSGWVLADRHDLRPCAASSLHRGTISVSNIIGGTGTLGIA